MRTIKLLLTASIVVRAFTFAEAQTVTVSPFNSVQLRNGGKVMLRHGPNQQVKLVRGSRDYTSIETNSQGVLLINKCPTRCPRDYVLQVEIVSPGFESVSVSEGGIIQTQTAFPMTRSLAVAVDNGGTVDLRSLVSDSVSASVREGGVILTHSQRSISASVFNGGNITYWGNAELKSSINGGGVIVKGEASDLNKPLSEMNIGVASLPLVPPLPTLPVRNLKR